MEHVDGWCFRGIYNVGLWEDDLHVSLVLAKSFNVCLISVYSIAHKFKMLARNLHKEDALQCDINFQEQVDRVITNREIMNTRK